MFTGLIEELGTVKEIRFLNQGANLTVSAKLAPELKIGDSIAVNGACLTVIQVKQNNFTVDITSETLSKTNLSFLTPQQKVNLERALLLKDRIAGHLVTGHVDEIGVINKKINSGLSILMEISASKNLLNFVVSKGSIAVDGISLTVVEVYEKGFSVNLIPHTVANTTLGIKGVGSKVNLESDILAKYIHRMFTIQPKISANYEFLNEEYFTKNEY